MNPILSPEGLWLRLSGMATIVVCLVFYEPGLSGIWQGLALPLLMGLGAWWLVRNLAAVAFGTLVLATIHANPGSSSWIDGIAYPLLVLASAATLLLIGVQRFRRRIAATHEARWANRRPTPAATED